MSDTEKSTQNANVGDSLWTTAAGVSFSLALLFAVTGTADHNTSNAAPVRSHHIETYISKESHTTETDCKSNRDGTISTAFNNIKRETAVIPILLLTLTAVTAGRAFRGEPLPKFVPGNYSEDQPQPTNA